MFVFFTMMRYILHQISSFCVLILNHNIVIFDCVVNVGQAIVRKFILLLFYLLSYFSECPILINCWFLLFVFFFLMHDPILHSLHLELGWNPTFLFLSNLMSPFFKFWRLMNRWRQEAKQHVWEESESGLYTLIYTLKYIGIQ